MAVETGPPHGAKPVVYPGGRGRKPPSHTGKTLLSAVSFQETRRQESRPDKEDTGTISRGACQDDSRGPATLPEDVGESRTRLRFPPSPAIVVWMSAACRKRRGWRSVALRKGMDDRGGCHVDRSLSPVDQPCGSQSGSARSRGAGRHDRRYAPTAGAFPTFLRHASPSGRQPADHSRTISIVAPSEIFTVRFRSVSWYLGSTALMAASASFPFTFSERRTE